MLEWSDYRKFPATYNLLVNTFVKQYGNSYEAFKLEMVYHETKKKPIFLSMLGEDYQNGELYFYEMSDKGNGIYASYNGQGGLDALIIEVVREKPNSHKFAMLETLFALGATSMYDSSNPAMMSPNELQRKIDAVLDGTSAYFDIYTVQNFYVRIKNMNTDDKYRRIGIFIPAGE